MADVCCGSRLGTLRSGRGERRAASVALGRVVRHGVGLLEREVRIQVTGESSLPKRSSRRPPARHRSGCARCCRAARTAGCWARRPKAWRRDRADGVARVAAAHAALSDEGFGSGGQMKSSVEEGRAARCQSATKSGLT
eukprot:scaffold3455_cov62-Phaeocystis_antarctica.AAC.3